MQVNIVHALNSHICSYDSIIKRNRTEPIVQYKYILIPSSRYTLHQFIKKKKKLFSYLM